MRLEKQRKTVGRLKTKRVLAALLCIALLAGLANGCVRKEPEVKQERKVVTLWHYWDQSFGKEMLTEQVKAYNASQKEVQIELKYYPDKDFKKQLALSIADGEMPDLALVDSADLRYFYDMQRLVDLSNQIDNYEGYLESVRETSYIDGKTVGLPMGLNCAVLYCNTRLLKEQGLDIPKTWEELYLATNLLSEEGRDSRYGFAMPALQSEETVYTFLPLLWSGGGDVDHLDSPESARAFSLLRALSESESMSTQTINLTNSDLAQQFMEGNIAMMLNGSTFAESIQEEKPELEFSISAPPVYDASEEPVTTMGGEVLVALQGGQQQEAVDFIHYMSEDNRILECLKGTGCLAPSKELMERQVEESELAREVAQIAQYARARELTVEWPYISVILTEAVGESVVGKTAEEEILNRAAEEIQKVREKAQ